MHNYIKSAMLAATAIAAAISFISCNRTVETIRIAQYNVGAFHKSDINTTAMVAAMIKEWNVDAISINELDSCNTRGGIDVDQLAEFAKELGGWNYHFGGAISYRGGTYGIGQASRPELTIVRQWNQKLPKAGGKEIRALVVTEFEKFVLCNTHLDLDYTSQLAQFNAIDSTVAANFSGCSKPVFLAGDMNALPTSATIAAIEQNWTNLTGTSFTFSAKNPNICIDYIFLYKNAAQCKPVRAIVGRNFTSGDVAVASDHCPVLLELEL